MASRGITTREIEDGPSGPSVGAFFDLDRTIIAGFSATAFLGQWVASGMMTPRDFLHTIVAATRFELGQIGFSAFVAETSSVLRDFSEQEYRQMAAGLFASWLSGAIYPESRSLVRAHQRKGHTVAVVSSATRYQIEPIAADLGIEHILCTDLEVRDGRFTGEVVHPTCFGEGKAVLAQQLADAHDIKMGESYFYTDSRDDLSLLNSVGHPRPVNPDSRLAEIAAKRGWPARHFHSRGRPTALEIIRTAMTFGSFGASLAVGLPAALLDQDWRRAVNLAATTWGEIGSAMAGVNVRVEGEANLWAKRPAVFIFNHQSALDVLLLCKLLRRDFVGIGKQEIRSYPILGPVLAMVGTVFIDRYDHEKAVDGLTPAVEALDEGLSVAIAPEGTRSPSPRLGRFKKGAFRLAIEAGVPIVPIVFLNALDALPKHGLVIRPTTVDVIVLDPIELSSWDIANLDDEIAGVRQLFDDTLESRGQ
jgi:putative phosphoserine phosphatase/1-acylglycerol-3-phosphate O-acyltransferase